MIRAAVGGRTAGQLFEGVRRFEILVRYPEGYRSSPEAIASILVPTPDGATVPLSELAEIGEKVGPRLTATTTTLGLVPLLVSTGTGSEVQQPLALVVVGGLATSTVLTLLVLPAIYPWFAPGPDAERRQTTE